MTNDFYVLRKSELYLVSGYDQRAEVQHFLKKHQLTNEFYVLRKSELYLVSGYDQRAEVQQIYIETFTVMPAFPFHLIIKKLLIQ